MEQEPQTIKTFRTWLQQNGAYIHPSVFFAQGPYGSSVFTSSALPKDSTSVSCPFNLIITPTLAREALQSLTGERCPLDDRNALCTYVVLHSSSCREKMGKIKSAEDTDALLKHQAYIDTLPADLLTPLFFTGPEFELLLGTNLYNATIERKANWLDWWRGALDYLKGVHLTAEEFTQENFLGAQTWISSRAFPSSLLDNPPSLTSPSAVPVLVPLVDTLNHARGTPISWSIDGTNPKRLSLVSHSQYQSGDEIFNNYGPKPNAELLLGYGFTLPANADDALLLKLSGSEKRFEIARDARGDAQAVWEEIERRLGGSPEEGHESDNEMDEEQQVEKTEIELEIGQVLPEMLLALRGKLPTPLDKDALLPGVRDEVRNMVHDYVEGQRDILNDMLAFAEKRFNAAIERAHILGIDVTLESEDDG